MIYEFFDLWSHLKNTSKPIYLYGMGNGAEKIIKVLSSIGVTPAGVFASDDFVRYQNFLGYTVCSYGDVIKKDREIIVLVSFGTQFDEVIENILRISSEQELYAPFVPLFGQELFDLSYFESHRTDLEKAFNLLSDDISRKAFSSVVTYRTTGKIKYLLESETPKEEIFEKLNLDDHPSFLDLGAYNGDTIEEFVNHFPKYSRIYGVEPDIKNFRKLFFNTVSLPSTSLYNAASGSRNEIALFSQKAGRNSSLSGSSGKRTPLMTVDSLLEGRDISYIKMDVEGEEENTILGAEKTVRTFHPRMLVSAYHRSRDIFSLPLLVNSLYDGYEVYFRHHRYIPDWDTNYYFI